jgi:hypothetical protein
VNDAPTPNYPANRVLRWRWPLIAAAAGIVLYVASHVLANMPEFVERVYVAGLWPMLSRPLSLLTGLVPFMLGEVLLAAYIIWLVVLCVMALSAVAQRRRHWRNAVAGGARRCVRDVGAIVFLFYLLWGVNYARAPFEKRAGWPDFTGIDVAQLTSLAETSVLLANQAYLELHQSDDAGSPTRFPEDMRELEGAVDEGWVRATHHLSLASVAAARYGRVKWPLASELLARFSIAGIYFPWTAEANVPRGLPAMRAAHSMAHEKAHQRGVSSEAEAEFVSYIAGALAPHPLSRYAAAMFAQGQLLAALRATSPAEVRRLVALRLPGVRRDLSDFSAYLRRYRGVTSRLGMAMNDRYLRANRVAEGIRDYARSTRLLITYAVQYGSVIPVWRESPRGMTHMTSYPVAGYQLNTTATDNARRPTRPYAELPGRTAPSR